MLIHPILLERAQSKPQISIFVWYEDNDNEGPTHCPKSNSTIVTQKQRRFSRESRDQTERETGKHTNGLTDERRLP